MNILYEDTALVVLDKPAGLTSEEGVPAALRQRWGRPDAYVGVIHRLDTGVSGLMVYARTPGAAAALTKQVTERARMLTMCNSLIPKTPSTVRRRAGAEKRPSSPPFPGGRTAARRSAGQCSL